MINITQQRRGQMRRSILYHLFFTSAFLGKHDGIVSGATMDVHLTLLADHNSINLIPSDSSTTTTSGDDMLFQQQTYKNELDDILSATSGFLSVHHKKDPSRKKHRNLGRTDAGSTTERDLNDEGGAAKTFRDGSSDNKAQQGIPMVSTILELSANNPEEALRELRDHGVIIRAIFPNNIITADVPVLNVKSLGAFTNVRRMEAAHKNQLLNDISNGFQTIPLEDSGGNLDGNNNEPPIAYVGMNNTRTSTGKGVVVGILDSGVDWTHDDFINDDGTSRILYYWDQTDPDDDAPPDDIEGFESSFGHEYTQKDFNKALRIFDHKWDPNTNSFAQTSNPFYPIKPSARDMNGHGTHVAGTAAGNGRGSKQMGVAPEASLIVVKYDTRSGPPDDEEDDDEGEEADRNNSASFMEGVYYIMKRAQELGMPVVVNMSLGFDYGPHDGTTLEERFYDDLIGPGRIVVAASGNSGIMNWSQQSFNGFAQHGSGNFKRGESVTVRMPKINLGFFRDNKANDEIFISGWYSGHDTMRIQITTPNGVVLPPKGYEDYWSTTGPSGSFKTTEGMVGVGNGGDVMGLQDNNIDHELYISIMSIRNSFFVFPPAEGEWKIEFLPLSEEEDDFGLKEALRSTLGHDGEEHEKQGYVFDTERLASNKSSSIDNEEERRSGDFHLWYGASYSVKYGWYQEPHPREPTPQINGRHPDNRFTINLPATANKVIAVGAYTSRTEWTYYDVELDGASKKTQSFSTPLNDETRVGELAYFSSRGPRRDHISKPDITAPGVGIASTYSHFVRQEEWAIVKGKSEKEDRPKRSVPTDLESGYVLPNLESVVMKGTSMASPNVAGVVALLLSENPTLDDVDIKNILKDSSLKDFYTETYEHYTKTGDTSEVDSDMDVETSNEDWGLGKINIYGALNEVKKY